MQYKEFTKRFQRFIARTAIQFCSFIVKIIPESCAYGFAHFVAKAAFTFAARQRRVAIESLKIAFGAQKTEEEIQNLYGKKLKKIVRMFVLENILKPYKEVIQDEY